MSPRSDLPPAHAHRRLTFVLRLWAHGREQPVWIGEVQELSTGEVTHVQGLEALFDWLRQRTAQTPEVSIENNPKNLIS